MSNRPKSSEMQPGTVLRYRPPQASKRFLHGTREVTLHRRKKMSESIHPGWWLTDGSGLADFVIDEEGSDWELVDTAGGFPR